MKRFLSILILICTLISCSPISVPAVAATSKASASQAACTIVTEPKTAYAQNGKTAKVTVKASGTGLKYQWYVKNEGATKYSKSSVTSSTYSVKMSSKVNNRLVYCKITDAYGNTVKTKSVRLCMKATIDEQPESVFAASGSKAKVTVKALGNGLKYEWYLKNATATRFTKSSVSSNTYSATMSSKVNGREVYCVVTDKYGNSVTTDTVELLMKADITFQPEDAYAPNGEKATVSLKATGNDLTYQWYYKNAGATEFKKSSVSSNSYSVKMSSSTNNRAVYCVVTDEYGNSVTSDVAHLRMELSITTQPEDVSAKEGETAKVTVKAAGSGLKYQWYIKNAGSSKFSKSSVTSSSYSVKMTSKTIGRSVYCVVTDEFGNSLTSETATLNHAHTVVIDKAVEPSYTAPGLTEGSHCSACGEVIVAQKEIPMLQSVYHKITYRNLKTAEAPEITQYPEETGLNELPVPEAAGYEFKGWYTASQGGQVVDYIPAGSTKDYILYARWELETYKIYYFDAPENDNETTYTVEDEIYLNDPNWSGMGFTGWTEINGKIATETDKRGNVRYKIEKGTTGNLRLTANWKLMRNIAVPGTNKVMLTEYDNKTGRYMFIYELGTIENVVLEELNSTTLGLYKHTGAGDFTLTMSRENTLEESVADSITRTISKAVSTSSEWEESKEWAKEKSSDHNVSVTIGTEFGTDYVKASVEAGYGYTTSSGSSWGESSSKGGSYGEETETGEEVGSSFSYLESMTTSSETSVTISGDSPHGYYDYVQAGNIRVFGVVTYDPIEENYYLNTYSMLDNMHGIVLYYPDVNSLNNPTCETLQYNIPTDKIEQTIENSYFIDYDANGGEGVMNPTLHTVKGGQKLQANAFTKEGYMFMGWEIRDNKGLTIATLTDSQVVDTALASAGERVTLYALWEKIDYFIQYEGNKPALGSTYVDNLPGDMACKFDEDVTLAAAPTLAGYTFGGWYFDSTCTQKVGDAGETLKKANLVSECGGSIKLYAKWTANSYKLIFDANGGTMNTTEMTVVFDSSFTGNGIETPVQAGADFLGWYLPDGSALQAPFYWRYAEDVTVTAKWLTTKQVVSLRIGHKDSNIKNGLNLVTDLDNVYDYIDPVMDRQALLDKGYTKLAISCSIWLYEKHDGNKDFWIRPYYDKTRAHLDHMEFASTKGKWNYHEWNFIILNLSDSGFSDTCAFWLEYGANGNQDDDWYAGDTWLTIQAIK